jgi:2-oxoisovalerate dehydrogenase E1 component
MEAPGLADQLERYRRMVRIRRFEERVVELYRDGAVPGFVHLSIGQEATAVGATTVMSWRRVSASTGHSVS